MNNAGTLPPRRPSQCNVCTSYLIAAISPPTLPPFFSFFFLRQLPALLGEDLRGGDGDGRPVSQGKAAGLPHPRPSPTPPPSPQQAN